MNYLFIINPHSGPSKNNINIRKLILKKINVNIDIKVTSCSGHAEKLAKEGLAKGFKNIIAVGGDGTMNEVARVLVNTNANLGLIPMGSGNGFARSLNIPLTSERALDTLLKNTIKKVDVGSANGIYFFVVSGVGFEAYVANRFQKSKRRGMLPYFYYAIKELIRYQYPSMTIESNDIKSIINPLTLAIANAPQYGNNAIISPKSDMQDGFIEACIVNKMGFIQSIKAVKYLFNGKIEDHDYYKTFKSNQITITSKEKIFFHTDGEVNKSTDKLIYNVIPKALNVIC